MALVVVVVHDINISDKNWQAACMEPWTPVKSTFQGASAQRSLRAKQRQTSRFSWTVGSVGCCISGGAVLSSRLVAILQFLSVRSALIDGCVMCRGFERPAPRTSEEPQAWGPSVIAMCFPSLAVPSSPGPKASTSFFYLAEP